MRRLLIAVVVTLAGSLAGLLAGTLPGSVVAAQAPRPAGPGWWPHWRGPAQNGVAPGTAPTTWSDTSNVAWKIEIPGRGHSSPIIWGDRIFITTAVPTGRKPEPPPAPEATGGGRGRGRGGFGSQSAASNEEQRFEVMAIDRLTGKTVWRQTALTATPHEGYHFQYGSFASNAPTTDGQRVYASFGSRGLYVYDMNGQLQWQKDFGLRMRMFNGFGEGVGPVLDGNRLLVLADVQIEAALFVHAQDQRLLIFRWNGLRACFRQIHFDALSQQRRRDHENDEQYEHHVDVRNDVDLRHQTLAAPRRGHA